MMSPDPTKAESAGAAPQSNLKKVPFNFRVGEWKLLSIARPLDVVDLESPASDWLSPTGSADGYLIKGAKAPVDPAMMKPRDGWTARVFREYPRHLIDLTTGYETYLASFSSKSRSTLKRKLRKFHDLSGGKAQWTQFRTKEEVARFLPVARELSAKTYQERLLGAGLPTSDEFTADVLARAEHEEVRAYILFLHDRPVSYLYLPVEGGRVIYAYLGYDPAYAEHSPGIVLQMLALEALFAEPRLSIFDFTEGAGQHKQLFATHSEDCADVLFVKRATLTSAVATAHAGFTRAEAQLTRMLDRIGVKGYLKRLLRKAATSTD